MEWNQLPGSSMRTVAAENVKHLEDTTQPLKLGQQTHADGERSLVIRELSLATDSSVQLV